MLTKEDKNWTVENFVTRGEFRSELDEVKKGIARVQELSRKTLTIVEKFSGDIADLEQKNKFGAVTLRNYAKEELIGKQVIAVVNFGVKQMDPEKSEVLILGVQNEQEKTIYLTPQTEVSLGVHVFQYCARTAACAFQSPRLYSLYVSTNRKTKLLGADRP